MDKILYEKIYDSEIYKTLEEYQKKNGDNVLWGGHNGTLCNESRETEFEYVQWMVDILQSISDKHINILETGTNYGSFSHICYAIFESFNLYTNDIVPESGDVVDKINQFYESDSVVFSNDVLQNLYPGNHSIYTKIEFDVAWLDSGHNFDTLYSEFLLCQKNGIKNLLVDDVYSSGEVTRAVGKFLYTHSEYRVRSFFLNPVYSTCGMWLELRDTETFK